MQTYILEGISSKPKTSKSGKQFISVGLMINGEWYNGFGKQGVTDQWEKGMQISGITLFTTPEGYKNWKFISIEERLSEIEKRLDNIERSIDSGVKPNMVMNSNAYRDSFEDNTPSAEGNNEDDLPF